MKKTSYSLLIISIINFVFSSWTNAQTIGSVFVVDNILYKVIKVGSPNEVSTSKYYSSGTDVLIPSTVTNADITYSVTSIGKYSFYNKSLTNVTIPSSVTIIDDSAFSDNLLTSLEIPDSVKSLGHSTFENNLLTSLVISNSVTEIGNSTFNNNNLTSVVIPSSVTSILPFAFKDNNLTSVTLPDSMTSIGYESFVNNSLSTLILPNSLIHIGSYAFKDNLLTSVTIPNSVEQIDNGSFQNNSLTSVTIPSSVTSIGSSAFFNNPNLTEVISESTIPPILNVIYSSNHFNQNSLINLTIPEGSEQEYLNANWQGFKTVNGNNFLFTNKDILYALTNLENNEVKTYDYIGTNTSVSIANKITDSNSNIYSVTEIGDDSFRSNSLKNIIIPNSIKSIGRRAFYSNFLTSITIPSSVTSIGSYAFRYSYVLTEVISENTNPLVLPDDTFNDYDKINLRVPTGSEQSYLEANWQGFKTINYTVSSFTTDNIKYSVTNFTNNQVKTHEYTGTESIVTIPETVTYTYIFSNTYSVTSIGNSTFKDKDITTITIPNSINSIGNYAFSQNSLTSTIIPETVTSIGDYAFSQNSLTSIIIPESVTAIGNSAFSNNELTSITIPDSVISLGDGVFQNNKLTSIILPKGITSIGSTAFSFNRLQNITIPSSVTSIGLAAFQFNNLSSVTIPDGLTSIGSSAFSYNNLTSIMLSNSLNLIGNEAFSNNNLNSITIPNSVTSIGLYAFADNKNLTEVFSKSNNPAILTGSVFYDNSIINLTIPVGTADIYTTANWIGFKSITDDTLSTNLIDNTSYKISVFPNPVNTLLHIVTNDNDELKSLTLYTTTGKKIIEEFNHDNILDVSTLASGTYILKTENKKGKITFKKIVKE